MKFDKQWMEKRWAGYTIAACSAVVLYLFLSHFNLILIGIGRFFGFISPVLIGIVIAYVMDPLVKFFQKTLFKKSKNEKTGRNASVGLSAVIVIAFIIILMAGLIPQLINSILGLIRNLGNYEKSLGSFLKSLNTGAAAKSVNITKLTEAGNDIVQKIVSAVPSNMDSILKTSVSIGSNAVMGVIAFILGIYFLIDKKRILNGVKNLFSLILPEKKYHAFGNFWLKCNTILIQYIICDLLDGLIIGTANAIFMAFAGMPYILLISVVVGVTNLAPTFGPIAGGVIGAFILVLVHPWYALWFIIFTIILQTCDGYVLKPKLFGGTMGVPSIWILICIIVGGRMFGVAGILLAIPFAAIFDYIWREMIYKKVSSRKTGRQQEHEDNALEQKETSAAE